MSGPPGPRSDLPNGGESKSYKEARKLRAKADKAKAAERKREKRVADFEAMKQRMKRGQKPLD